jgi:hypothetical protein
MHYEGELIAVVAHDDYVGRVMRPLQETATAKTPPSPPPDRDRPPQVGVWSSTLKDLKKQSWLRQTGTGPSRKGS